MTTPNRPPESRDQLPTGLPEWLCESFVDDLPVCVILKDLEGRFTYVNGMTARLLGEPVESILGKTDLDLFPKELAQKYMDDDRAVISSGQAVEQIETHSSSAVTRLVKVRKKPVRRQDGTIIGIEVVFRDVTKHQSAAADLERERFLLQTLLNNLPDFIYFKDRESRFLRLSRAHAERLGLAEADDAVGTTDSDYFSEDYAKAAREDELRLMRTGQDVLGHQEHAVWPDGSETWVATSKLPLRDESGQVVGTFGISRDISELKATAEQLRHAKEVAEAASRAKSEFVANLSHEIRTPMNAIIGMAELLVSDGLEGVRAEQAKTILESGECLLALLNEILDFSRIESGRVELDPVPGELRDFVGGVIRMLGIRANEKSIELKSDIDADVPNHIVADFVRLRQILVNLVGNALKFTEHGEVTLHVDQDSVSNESVTLRFSVSDTGIGIPNDKLDRIFEEFEQADKSTTRQYGGTGLGLAITSRLVQLMGGQIEVESQIGRGSTFSFSLDFPVVANQEDPNPEDNPKDPGHQDAQRRVEDSEGSSRQIQIASKNLAKPLRILLAEDSPTNQKVATMMLSKAGHIIKVANNGHEAVELSGKEEFNLILMDLEMPELDGLQATRQIRDREIDTGTHIPIIAMTAHAMASDEQRCLDAGMDAYIAKPIRQEIVFATIQRITEQHLE